jgi:hypothetical protein
MFTIKYPSKFVRTSYCMKVYGRLGNEAPCILYFEKWSRAFGQLLARESHSYPMYVGSYTWLRREEFLTAVKNLNPPPLLEVTTIFISEGCKNTSVFGPSDTTFAIPTELLQLPVR